MSNFYTLDFKFDCLNDYDVTTLYQVLLILKDLNLAGYIDIDDNYFKLANAIHTNLFNRIDECIKYGIVDLK